MIRGSLNDQRRTEQAYETITRSRLEEAVSDTGYWTPLKYFCLLIEGAMAARDGRAYENKAELGEALTEILRTFHYDKEDLAKGRFEPLDLSRHKASVAIHVNPLYKDRFREGVGVKSSKRGHNG